VIWETHRVGSALAHVMIVGGTLREWESIAPHRWDALIAEWANVVAAAGGSWLTVRAYEDGSAAHRGSTAERRVVSAAGGQCTVIIDPQRDGREHFAEAMRALPDASAVDEKTVTGVLYAPADVEPDLVVVLGPPTRLPPSLVWELAYGELVFSELSLEQLDAASLHEAIEEYGRRQRRFGGLDT
jgi:undecaprenyl diphosphate synthase